jgi:hypothetical protein
MNEQLQNYNKSFLVSRITKSEIEEALNSVTKFSEIGSSMTDLYERVEISVAIQALI